MSFNSSRGNGLRSEINVTPLVDVVLVLLIIFMVVTPILQMGLDVEVPPKVEISTPQPPSEQTQLVVVVKGDGTYLNSKRMASASELKTTLASILAGRKNQADRVVFVNSEDNLQFSGAVAAIDAAKGAGAYKIGFLTDPPK